MNQRLRRSSEPAWAALSDDQLMKVRFRDLKLSIEGTWLEDCLQTLYGELARKGITARPHAWLADDWFSPHNTPGIAIPFFLAHPRLMRLERKKVLEIDGGNRAEAMRILRHEAGHVVQRLYGLHRRAKWREVFGRSSVPYPDHYRPDPTSKRYVQHLRRWYAQSHPDEDFAETFAVWLTPRSNWRKRYADWPAMKKLLYVDELMSEIAGMKAPSRPRYEIDPIDRLQRTIGEYYREKCERYAFDCPTIFDRDLLRMFPREEGQNRAPHAATVIRRNRSEIRRAVARCSGEHQLALEAALEDVIDRCRTLQLRAPGSERRLRGDLTALLTTKSVQSMYSSRRQAFAV